MRIDPRSALLTALTAASGLAIVLTTPRSAPAWPPYLADWQSTYPASMTDDNVIATQGQGCAVCHFSPSGGTGWNPYGWEIRKRYLAGGVTIPQAIVLAERWDSEENPRSWSNITEINAGTQPGWTDGPNNREYTDSGVVTGQMPVAVLGTYNPAASPMVPLCDPGVNGVIACPCANPSNGLNRGCDNSSMTTGGALTATGVASLAADTLLFTSNGERPTAFTIVLQGQNSLASGITYGQGVRCVNVNLKRLYNRNAVGGSLTVPNAGMGDPSVSAQSAAKGDTITGGTSRYYLFYYRDPNVLGGCPSSSTFNATQTGRVDWSL